MNGKGSAIVGVEVGAEWAAERNLGTEGGEEHDYHIRCNTQCTIQRLPQYRK